MPDLKATVWILAHINSLASQRAAGPGRLEDDQHLVVMQRQRPGHSTPLTPDHRRLEILMQGERTVHISRVKRRLGKALIIPRHIARQERVGLGNGRNAFKPHRLDQTILQRAVGAFNPPLGLRRVGADDLDVEFLQRPPKMGKRRRNPALLGGVIYPNGRVEGGLASA